MLTGYLMEKIYKNVFSKYMNKHIVIFIIGFLFGILYGLTIKYPLNTVKIDNLQHLCSPKSKIVSVKVALSGDITEIICSDKRRIETGK